MQEQYIKLMEVEGMLDLELINNYLILLKL